MIATDWGNRVALDAIVMPDATPDWIAHVIERGLDHASGLGFEMVQMEVDRADNGDRSTGVKICFEADNEASSHLYRSVGFEPVKQTDVFAGRTNTQAS